MISLIENRGPFSASAQNVADNASTSARVLHRLARNSDVQVRTSVADNVNTQMPTLMQLALDENLDLRYALAENHNINTKVLQLLSDDTNPYVASRAKRTLSRLEEMTKRPKSLTVLFGIASRYPRTQRKISRQVS